MNSFKTAAISILGFIVIALTIFLFLKYDIGKYKKNNDLKEKIIVFDEFDVKRILSLRLLPNSRERMVLSKGSLEYIPNIEVGKVILIPKDVGKYPLDSAGFIISINSSSEEGEIIMMESISPSEVYKVMSDQ